MVGGPYLVGMGRPVRALPPRLPLVRERGRSAAKSNRVPADVELVRILRAFRSEAPGRKARMSDVDIKARYALRRIHRILESLSAAERLALVLRYMATLKNDEVAALLAVPVGTVKRWVDHAPSAFRDDVTKERRSDRERSRRAIPGLPAARSGRRK